MKFVGEQIMRLTGMRAFAIVCVGQLFSLLGTAMTRFALTIWAYEETGSATALALTAFFSYAPGIILSPFAGALVDRWNRKLVMILSDLGAGISTIVLLLLYASGNLQIWHLYAAGAFAGIFGAFQWPAYSAAISTMLPKSQYARASGMLGVTESLATVIAPTLAVALLVVIGISGVMLIDIITFIFAIAMLLIVTIPQPATSAAGREGKGSLISEASYGFRYIFRRPSLLSLQLMLFFTNLTWTLSSTILAPMLLARTGSSETTLATVQTVGAIGGVAGGLLLSVWGGPKRRVHGVLMSMVLSSVLGQILFGVGQTVLVWMVAAFFTHALMPILNGSNQAIWQAKVAPDVQGRVFAARLMIAQITAPVGMLLAGPLADQVFEPAMQADGSLAPVFGGLVGVGPGAGMALMFVLFGTIRALTGLSGYAFPTVRDAEDLLPDHDASAAVPA